MNNPNTLESKKSIPETLYELRQSKKILENIDKKIEDWKDKEIKFQTEKNEDIQRLKTASLDAQVSIKESREALEFQGINTDDESLETLHQKMINLFNQNINSDSNHSQNSKNDLNTEKLNIEEYENAQDYTDEVSQHKARPIETLAGMNVQPEIENVDIDIDVNQNTKEKSSSHVDDKILSHSYNKLTENHPHLHEGFKGEEIDIGF